MNLSLFWVATAAASLSVTLTWGRPFTGHFTVIRPNGETITQNYINRPAAPARLQNKRKNSPTYFIKLAPSPYTFVPGLGYVSQPPVENPFFSVNFPSNGKPTGIYSLNSLRQSTTAAPSIDRADSPISWMKGRFMFNGRPKDRVTAVHAPASSSLLNAILARRRNQEALFNSRRGRIAPIW